MAFLIRTVGEKNHFLENIAIAFYELASHFIWLSQWLVNDN